MTLANDNGTDGQTDRQTDRQSATQYAAPPREEGRIITVLSPKPFFFGSNMHQIVQRIGLSLRPHWWSSRRSPDPLASKGGGKGEGREGKGGNRKEGMEGKGGCLRLNLSLATPLVINELCSCCQLCYLFATTVTLQMRCKAFI